VKSPGKKLTFEDRRLRRRCRYCNFFHFRLNIFCYSVILFNSASLDFIASFNLPEEYRAQGIRLLKLIDVYEQCLGEMEEEQKEVLITHRDESTISLSMPGIGPKTAFVLLAYLGNMERFSSCRQVGYFSGFTPSIDISGQQEHYGSITKRGPKQVRRVMNQAAWAAIRSQDGIILREFYDRVRSTKGKNIRIMSTGLTRTSDRSPSMWGPLIFL